jgi:hypothetical protein
MSKMELSKLKTLLQQTMVKLGQDGSISSQTVISAVRKSSPEAISLASTDLEDFAMHWFFSRIAAMTPKDQRQAELFADYRGVHQFITIERPGQKAPDWKLLSKATLREVGTWLRKDRKKPSTKRVREPAMARMLRDLSRASKGRLDITVEAALVLRAAQAGKRT